MVMQECKNVEIKRGTENVFADLGLANAEQHFVKAQLVAQILDIVHERDLTNAEAAMVMGIGQNGVSELSVGRFRDYSIGHLLGFLLSLDRDIEIVVKAKVDRDEPARMTVKAA